MSKEIIFYYLVSYDVAICSFLSNDTIEEKKYEDIKKLNHFEMFDTYPTTHEGLIKFKEDMIQMNKDLKSVLIKSSSGKPFRINYLDNMTHTGAVLNRFMHCNLNKGLKMDIDSRMSKDEFYFHEKSNGTGLMTLNEDYKGKFINAHGYDYSRFYPHLLCDKDFKFPLSSGQGKRFKSVNFNKLRFGLYNVKVTCHDKRFLSMFRYNPKHYYDNETLMFLNEIKEEYNIKLELLRDNEGSNNAYIYESVESGQDHFKQWFDELEHVRIELEEKGIKSILLKTLMSSLWGRLTAFENHYYTYEECSKLKSISHRVSGRETKYKIIDLLVDKNRIIDVENAYKYKFGRMKVFLTAYGRLKMLKLGHQIYMTSTAEIIRIHTDGIILSEAFDMGTTSNLWDKKIHAKYFPKPDEKISGVLMFNDCLYQHRKCTKCKCEYKVFGGSIEMCSTCL